MLKDYKRAASSAYLFLILAVLPLYMQDGLTQIGNVKYTFFRNVSLLFLVIWTILVLAAGIGWLRQQGGEHGKISLVLSATDGFALAFGVATLFSYCFSSYKETAFWGFSGWYMGTVSQILFLWGFLFVSRWYARERWVETTILISAAAVALLGVLNRYGKDPLGVFSDIPWYDWNRRNLLATVGNINWYCGYLSVVVPLLVAFYWGYRGRLAGRLLAGAGVLTGLASMMLQGSDSGYGVLAVMLVVLLAGSVGELEQEMRFLEILILLVLNCCFSVLLVNKTEEEILLPAGSHVIEVMESPAWLAVLIIALFCYGVLWYRKRRGDASFTDGQKGRRFLLLLAAISAAAAMFIVIGCQLSDAFWQWMGAPDFLRIDDRWGSFRGFLWRVSMEEFGSSSMIRKLFGVGPDCFADYMYQHNTMDILISGQWNDAVFANAHNEWLNMLINEGILGLICYGGFFLTAFCRFFRQSRKQPMLIAGALVVAAYTVNGFFSFQQVVSTPLVFLVVGMCESSCRKEVSGVTDEGGKIEGEV